MARASQRWYTIGSFTAILRHSHHFHQVRVTWCFLLCPMHCHNRVARFNHALRHCLLERFGNHGVCSHKRGRHHWNHTTHHAQLTHCRRTCSDCENWNSWPVLCNHPCCVAGLCERDDQSAV